jgi:hypothetical protein
LDLGVSHQLDRSDITGQPAIPDRLFSKLRHRARAQTLARSSTGVVPEMRLLHALISIRPLALYVPLLNSSRLSFILDKSACASFSFSLTPDVAPAHV